MLGKQVWRLMANPSSLCPRVLKGRYYPNDTFLSAQKKKNLSHTWHAILAGRGVLEKALIRRIGDGTTTDIWNDRWIPGAIGMKPICKPDGASATQVCDLLTPSRDPGTMELCLKILCIWMLWLLNASLLLVLVRIWGLDERETWHVLD
jgi:hypothetical protein